MYWRVKAWVQLVQEIMRREVNRGVRRQGEGRVLDDDGDGVVGDGDCEDNEGGGCGDCDKGWELIIDTCSKAGGLSGDDGDGMEERSGLGDRYGSGVVVEFEARTKRGIRGSKLHPRHYTI